MAAIEAMTMTQSVEALLSVIYRDQTFEKVLYGDSASAISILQNPDGSWRTRHLRLRANCLRERLRQDEEHWKLRHVRGTLLIADLLTKAVTQLGSWRRFWKFLDFWSTNMKMWTDPVESEKTLKGPSRVGENRDNSSARDLGEKIAKVGCLLRDFRQIPDGSFQGCWTDEVRSVLSFVFTVLIVWLTWKLIGKKEPKRFRCTDLQPEAKEDSEKEKQSEKAKDQKESQEAREDEPALNTEQGSLKENELRLQERERGE